MQSYCGLCTALATVFRRFMCISGSRRGSHESYYTSEQQNLAQNSTASDPAAILITVEEPNEKCFMARRLSEGEILLISTMEPRSRRTGRFLTMHKRRRRKLTTRFLQDSPAVLDDLYHGQVQSVLNKVWQWPFNAFTLDVVTGGRSLPVLCVHLFHWYGLIEYFTLDVVRIWKFFTLVEEGYHSSNPYHNATHATDVTQAMHCFLQEEKIKDHLRPIEILSALIAAVTHDLDHPGVNQPFLIATSNHLAALYENTSVLENHHWRSAIGCLIESNVAEQITSVRPELEQQVASLILATDITRQQEFLTKFKSALDDGVLDMTKEEDRHFILQIALKCADISNPCRPWDISKKWSLKVCEEFFRQGDYERELNLPVTALCDRQTSSVPKIQTGFFRFVVEPLYKEWHRFLDTPLSKIMMDHLTRNYCKWEAMIQDEIAQDTRAEISEAEENVEEAPERRGSFLTVPTSRRHSVPVSSTAKVRELRRCSRRESLPEPRRRFSPMFDEEDEWSPISSCSNLHSSAGSYTEERPLSSEALVPDLSIASMTSSSEVQRLTHLLHGSNSTQTGRLTRQQTFPPVQPYIRPRYLSDSGQRGSSSSESSNFEPCLDTKPLIVKEKENVDPDKVTKINKKTSPQVNILWKRRGSAPVALPSDHGSNSSRRSSMPVEAMSIFLKKGTGTLAIIEDEDSKRRNKKLVKRRSSGGPESCGAKEGLTRRRGSLPVEALTLSLSGWLVTTYIH